MTEPNRQELERLWRQRWEEAKLKLELATIRLGEIERQMRITPRPRASDAYRAALEAQGSALAEYSRVLRIYTDLVVHGNIPEEPAGDPPQCKTNSAGAD